MKSKFKKLSIATTCLSFTYGLISATAGEAPIDLVTAGRSVDRAITSEDETGINLQGHLHFLSAYGFSSAADGSLATNDHDPQRAATLQTFEPGLSLRAGKLQGFANATGLTDSNGDFSFALEEAFLKLAELPLGLQFRGGQYFNRFGFQNSVHNHGWANVDQNLVNGRFLNEGELITQGGEISWNLPLSAMRASILSVSIGEVQAHDHGHGDEEHSEESMFEAEGANFTGRVVTAAWVNQYDINDRNRITGIVSGAWGDNLFDRSTQLYGIGLEYLWRENGYDPGGNSLRWRNELMYRQIGSVSGHLPGEEEDEHDDGEQADEEEVPLRANLNEFGLYSSLVYGFDDKIETGLRAGWVSGISEAGLDDRLRISPAITWYANRARTVQARLQYNWDHSNDFGNEHSVWLQFGLNFGSGHVR
ncbi:MAG: hypothetical protein ACI8XO_003054 [Verrucomicrobiales bacterium]|jgi:hypothetical protein